MIKVGERVSSKVEIVVGDDRNETPVVQPGDAGTITAVNFNSGRISVDWDGGHSSTDIPLDLIETSDWSL